MRIAYNPITEEPLISVPQNDIIFDLPGKVIYAKGEKFDGRTLLPFERDQNGLVPAPYNNTNTRFLREDGSWQDIVKVPQAENADTINDYSIKVVNGAPGSDSKTIYFVI